MTDRRSRQHDAVQKPSPSASGYRRSTCASPSEAFVAQEGKIDPLEALNAAWRVTVAALIMLAMAHSVGSIWNTRIYMRSLTRSLAYNELVPAL